MRHLGWEAQKAAGALITAGRQGGRRSRDAEEMKGVPADDQMVFVSALACSCPSPHLFCDAPPPNSGAKGPSLPRIAPALAGMTTRIPGARMSVPAGFPPRGYRAEMHFGGEGAHFDGSRPAAAPGAPPAGAEGVPSGVV